MLNLTFGTVFPIVVGSRSPSVTASINTFNTLVFICTVEIGRGKSLGLTPEEFEPIFL